MQQSSALTRYLGRLVLVVEVVQLLLWFVAPGLLGTILMGEAPTRPSTALALLLLGLVLAFTLDRRVEKFLLFLITGLAVEGLVALAIDRPILAADPLYPPRWREVLPDGRMALSSALVLLALVLMLAADRKRPRVATAAGGMAGLGALAGLIGHLYGASALTTLETATAMSVPTALACLAVSGAGVVRRPGLPVARILGQGGEVGHLVRTYAVPAVLTPTLVGWSVVTAERAGWFDAAYGQSVMVLVLTVGTVAGLVLTASTAQRVENGRLAEAARERLQFVLDRTPVGIVECDRQGRRTYVNARWAELTGHPLEGALGADVLETLHPDDRDRVEAGWRACVASGEDFFTRYRYVQPGGQVVWVEALATASHDKRGGVTRWLGSVTDVTAQVEANARLEASEQRYRSVITTMAEGVVMQDARGRIVTANDAAARLLGLSHDEMLGRTSIDPRWRTIHEDGTDLPGTDHPAMRSLATAAAVRGVTMGVHRPDGSLVWIEVSSEPLLETLLDGLTVATAVVTTFSDVTTARRDARALARSEEQFRSAMEHAPIGMALVALDGSFMQVNRSLCTLFGYDEAELLVKGFQEMTHPDDLGTDLENLQRLVTREIAHYEMQKRYLTRTGEVVWADLAVSLVCDDDDQPAHFVAQVQDITASRAATERLAHRALHDPLTGLANRDLLTDRLSLALSRSSRSGTSTLVLFCDLDRFKAVNDTYGHDTGDLVLVETAERLRRAVRPSDTVSRLGGDEFVVVAEGLDSPADQRALTDRVRAVLGEPIEVNGQVLQARASVGVAVARPEDDARSLLREADAAMYRAKARSRRTYSAAETLVRELGPIGS